MNNAGYPAGNAGYSCQHFLQDVHFSGQPLADRVVNTRTLGKLMADGANLAYINHNIFKPVEGEDVTTGFDV